ncbi:hypothetical protein NDU88_002383 [Pleurodeles waltl]|uniref:Uncharacterized protein n=1 Tax=Pleurodeles waltl TaxID=8319 RepID=A0AAV7RDS6_PLEWA|nr:hypothetical protein NDU88_002383 [Pleurodeles waltl]
MVSAALLTQGAGTRSSLSPFRRADLLRPRKTRLRPRAGPFLSRCAAVFPAAVSKPPRQRSSLGVLEEPLEGLWFYLRRPRDPCRPLEFDVARTSRVRQPFSFAARPRPPLTDC